MTNNSSIVRMEPPVATQGENDPQKSPSFLFEVIGKSPNPMEVYSW